MRETSIILFSVVLLCVLFFRAGELHEQQSPTGLLTGYGCEGTGGIIYAYEESDFPKCHLIHRKE